MGSINHNNLEKADMSKRPKTKNPESDQHKDKHKIRFQFVTVEMLEKHGKMSDEEVIFPKTSASFSSGFQTRETVETTRPQAEWFYCFRSTSFEITSPTRKISLTYHLNKFSQFNYYI